MSELRKANTESLYFVTLTVVGWIDIFTRKRYSDVVIESLQHCQKHKGLMLYAYVIMPSHLHLIVSNPDAELPIFLRDFKRFTSREIIGMITKEPGESRSSWLLNLFKHYAGNKKQNPGNQFWQKTNYPIELTSNAQKDRVLAYIHDNPVKAGIVKHPADFVYSSANEEQILKLDVM